MRIQKFYPVPNVCPNRWTQEDWERIAVYKDTEPGVIQALDTFWIKTTQPRTGELLYMHVRFVYSRLLPPHTP